MRHGRGAYRGRRGGTEHLLVDDSDRVLPRLFEAAADNGVRIASAAIREPGLEAAFLRLTGRGLGGWCCNRSCRRVSF